MIRQDILVTILAQTPEAAALLAEKVAFAALDAAEEHDDPRSCVRVRGYGATIHWKTNASD